MDRSLTKALPPVSGRADTPVEAIAVLRAALTDPSVTAQTLTDAIKRVSHHMRHCRSEMYRGDEPLQAEFVLLLAAAKLAAHASDGVGDCVASYRWRAEREFAGYTLELDHEISVLCCNALEQIIKHNGYPVHTKYARAYVRDLYWQICLEEIYRALVLDAYAENEARTAQTGPLALAN